MRFGRFLLFYVFCWELLSSCATHYAVRIPASESLSMDQDSFQVGLNEFNQRLELAKSKISNPRHYPKILHHGKRTEYVVVFTHGLFESPSFLQALSDNFYKRGMNVVLPLMPGHWSVPPSGIKSVRYKQWLEEEAANIEIAKKLGNKIILAGYSLGGELSLEAYFSKKYNVSALLLFAPALGLHLQTAAASEWGWILGIDGNGHQGIPMADGYDVAFYAPQPGLEVFSLIKYVLNTNRSPLARSVSDMFIYPQLRRELYSKVVVPTFVAASRIDNIVSKEEIDLFYSSLGGAKDGIFFDDVTHRDLAKSRTDVFFWRPDGYNIHFDEMLERVNLFLDKYCPR